MFTRIKASLNTGVITVSFALSKSVNASVLLADVAYDTSHTLVGLERDQREFSLEAPESTVGYSVTLKALVNGTWVESEEVAVTA